MLALPDAHWDRLIQTLGLVNVGSILDVGCGAGAWLPALARVNALVIGVDEDADVVDGARLRTSSMSNVQVHAMAAESLGFPSQTFDAVVCFTVLPYLDHARALPEIARVLKSDGRLHLGTVGAGYYARHAAMGIARGNVRAIRYGLEPIMVTAVRATAGERIVPDSLQAWTIGAVQRLLESHGLTVDAVMRDATAIAPDWPSNFLGLPMYFLVSATRCAPRPIPGERRARVGASR